MLVEAGADPVPEATPLVATVVALETVATGVLAAVETETTVERASEVEA
jgi:hypothetical protein